MLLSLHIENYALISTLHVQFDRGMTVITGETGAGKSIIMGALSLILGNRADLGVLFDKSKKCSVEAVFDIKGLELTSFFEQNDLDYQDNTIVRREITESGKSRAFINDTPVNLTVLKEFASRLIDIHSQHHNLLFHNADFRIAMLDEFARTQSEALSYRAVLKELKQKETELSERLEIQRNRLEKRDFMQFVYDELALFLKKVKDENGLSVTQSVFFRYLSHPDHCNLGISENSLKALILEAKRRIS